MGAGPALLAHTPGVGALPSFVGIALSYLSQQLEVFTENLKLIDEAHTQKLSRSAKMELYRGGDTVSTEAVAARRHAGTHLPVTWWKLEMPTTTWHLLLN